MKYITALSLLFCVNLFAQQTSTFQRDKPIILSVEAPEPTADIDSFITWSVDKSTLEFRQQNNGRTLYCWAAPGNYRLLATTTTIDWNKRKFNVDTRSIDIVVTGGTPQPPEPPQPPQPPVPGEDVSINPLGFTVLILKENETFNEDEKTLQVLNSTKIARYLNEKAYKEPGGYVAWRKWDDDYSDEAFKNQPAYWTLAYHKAITSSQGKRPWLLISTPTKTVQFDISDMSEIEVLNLLQKYGG